MLPINRDTFATELSEWLKATFPAAPASALDAVRLVATRAEEGHVCVALPLEAGGNWNGIALPTLANWLDDLQQSSFVGAPGSYQPLIRDGERLYLGRLWADEVALATQLNQRAGPSQLEPKQIRTTLAPLFAGSDGRDGQYLAAATALLNQVAVISGGPGTGKTTTVAKVLAALVQLENGSRIKLAAPTGKAAARMVEALTAAKQKLGLDLITQAELPTEATTLHRLLGYRPDSATPRHGPDNPLALDVLVVDEASMIDLALFTRLLQALPRHARLILLGDRDQLASVEAGSAFAELVKLAGLSTAGAARLSAATGSSIKPVIATQPHALADGIALLNISHRFGAHSGIGALARCANTGQVDAAIQLLREQRADLAWQPGRVRDWLTDLLATLDARLANYRLAIQHHDIAGAFEAFDRLRLLCALRDGPVGVETINRLIETRLWRQDIRRQPWYAGRPVIVRANDAALGLANGDVGLVLADPDGLRVYFPQQADWRVLAPARLPAHDTAFALTVHQSQGSEFDEVWLLLPDEDAAVLNRSLIYTAVTRAKTKLALWGSATTLASAIARETQRDSGLLDRLVMA